MAADTYLGNFGGNWFDPSNWNAGEPVPGDVADIFGTTGADASAGTVAGVTIDLSATYLPQAPGDLAPPTYNLVAESLGTAAAPVAIVVTADSGRTAAAAISVDVVDGSVTVDAGQSLVIDGGEIDGKVLVGAGATLAFEGYTDLGGFEIFPNVTFDGAVDVDGGTLLLSSTDVTGTGRIEIAHGGLVEVAVAGPFQPSQSIDVGFDGTGGTLEFASSMNSYEGVISGFGPGDVIKGPAGDRAEPLMATWQDGVLSITQEGRFLESYRFDGSYVRANFDVGESPDGFAEVTFAPCFATGTGIATADGPVGVERLVAGRSVVVQATGELSRVAWIGHRRQCGGVVVRVRAGALGGQTPYRDLVVSSDHGLFLDGVLVPAGLLVDGETIVREWREEVVFWHVELERHGILLAEGAAAESYLDTGNRAQFGNCPLCYDARDAARHEPCAEMVFAGSRLERIRTGLARLSVAPSGLAASGGYHDTMT